MDSETTLTRSTLAVVWTLGLVALAVWSSLAWGINALVSGSGDWLYAHMEPWLTGAAWASRIDSFLGLAEGAGVLAVWLVWGLGSLGLLLTVAFATALFWRARRWTSSPR